MSSNGREYYIVFGPIIVPCVTPGKDFDLKQFNLTVCYPQDWIKIQCQGKIVDGPKLHID